MIRLLNGAAVAAGLGAALWVAFTHAGSHPAVLPLLLLIVAAFATGVLELHRYRQQTAALLQALEAVQASPPAELAPWFATIPEELRGAVRARLRGDRVALPGPALAPFLTGLLVLLGLLGTFIGMVATLSGTVSALGTSADLQAVRQALGAPVQGLGLAFGTSVAGVAASAALGLISALARRERMVVSRRLDEAVAGPLHAHTQEHRQHRLVQAMEAAAVQAQALPAALTQGLGDTALTFEQGLREAMSSLERSLVSASDRAHRESRAVMEPMVQTALQRLLQEVAEHHRQTQAEMGRQAGRTAEHLAEIATSTAQRVEQATVTTAQRVEQASLAQAQRIAESAAQTVQQVAEHLNAATAVVHQTALQTDQTLRASGEATVKALLDSVQQAMDAWAGQVSRTDAMLRQHADQTSQAVVDNSRQGLERFLTHAQEQAAQGAAREHEQLAERQRVLGSVDTLMQALQHAATTQAQALDDLLASAADKLDRSADHFDSQAAQVAQSLAAATEQAGASSRALSEVGAAFAESLSNFGQVNAELGQQLARVEAALGQHLSRSDEQLAYYVAQAREVIELTLGAQQRLLEDLRQVSRVAAAGAVASV